MVKLYISSFPVPKVFEHLLPYSLILVVIPISLDDFIRYRSEKTMLSLYFSTKTSPSRDKHSSNAQKSQMSTHNISTRAFNFIIVCFQFHIHMCSVYSPIRYNHRHFPTPSHPLENTKSTISPVHKQASYQHTEFMETSIWYVTVLFIRATPTKCFIISFYHRPFRGNLSEE